MNGISSLAKLVDDSLGELLSNTPQALTKPRNHVKLTSDFIGVYNAAPFNLVQVN